MKININNFPLLYTDKRKHEAYKNCIVTNQNIYSQYNLEKYLINRANLNKINFGGQSSIQKAYAFEETLDKYYRYIPDNYQIDAAKSIYDGNDTIVTAPTGSGKTLIAEYVIKKNLDERKRTFYTTPLKALSNQKMSDFSKLFNAYGNLSRKYGNKNVGLLTGDFEYNKDAPVIVMTTEVYRNMLLSKSKEQVADDLRNVKTVIFDEFHYMNDKERGIVWEESIMHSPEHIQLVPLSATIPNAIELANWFKRINPTKNVQIIRANPNDRHVPLRYFTYDKNFIPLMDEYINPDKLLQQLMEERMGEKKEKTLSRLGEIYYGIQDPYKGIEILTDYVNGDEIKKQSLYYNLIYDKKLSEDEAAAISESLVENDSRTINPSIQSLQANYTNEDSLPTIELIRTLSKQDMLPAIFFIFSKKSCDKQVERYIEYTKKSGCKSLLTEKEQKQVKKIIKEYNDKGIFLGANFDPKGLLLGVAAHHAGMLPGYRDLVEQLFQKKLIKVVFATETLSAGINMPTRTTVITSLMKPDNSDLTKKQNNNQQNSDKSALRCLTSTELKQMTGRAGRRGIDTIGNVIILNSSNNALDQAVNLIKSDPDPIKSNFKPSYSFLSFFLNHNENMQDITQIVEKSFLLDSVKSNNILNAKNSVIYDFDRIKNIFKKRGFIELKPGTTNSWNVTPLGQLASKARGINEVLLSELVYNAKLNGLSPEGFAAVIATMKQDRVPNLQENIDFSDFYKIFKKQGFADQFEEIKNDINYIKNLSSEIDIAQIKEGLNEPKTQIDVAIVPYIFMWANACKRTNDQDKEKCYQAWENVVTALQKDRIITYEGQFAKNINSTIDILNQIQSLSNNMKSRFKPDTDEFKLYKKQEYLAKEAVKSLKKPPIGEVIWDYDSEPGVVV